MFPSITNSISQEYEIANQSDSTKHKITERVFTGYDFVFLLYILNFPSVIQNVSVLLTSTTASLQLVSDKSKTPLLIFK